MNKGFSVSAALIAVLAILALWTTANAKPTPSAVQGNVPPVMLQDEHYLYIQYGANTVQRIRKTDMKVDKTASW